VLAKGRGRDYAVGEREGKELGCWGEEGDWLIDYLLFYVPLKNISLIWRCHHNH
jgi:hypothetical protein